MFFFINIFYILKMFVRLPNKITNAMSKIKLREILEAKGIKIVTAGERLFPKSRNPYMSIKRVLDGKSLLDSEQIAELSELTETPIQNLFDWVGPKAKEGFIIFTFGAYTAELNTQTWETKVFEKGVLFHEVTIPETGVKLSEYLKAITEIVNTK